MVMIRHSRPVLGAAALLFVACGPDTRDEPAADMPAVPATEQQPAAVTDFTAEMIALDGSATRGSIYIDTRGDSPVISVALRGADEGVHQGHIHTGTCAQPGGAVVPLEPVETNAAGNGESISEVGIPADSLLNGQHIIVFHEAGGTPGAAVVCGEIPARD
jgi:hypothetical protein